MSDSKTDFKDEDGKCCAESGSGVQADYKLGKDNDVSKYDSSKKPFKTSTTNAQNRKEVSDFKVSDRKVDPESGSCVKNDYKFVKDNDYLKGDVSRRPFETSTTNAQNRKKVSDFRHEDGKGCPESGSGVKTYYKFEEDHDVSKGYDSRKKFLTSSTNAQNRRKVSDNKVKDGKVCLESGSDVKTNFKFKIDNDVSKDGGSKKPFKTSATDAKNRNEVSYFKVVDEKVFPESGSGVKTNYKFKLDDDDSKGADSRKPFKTFITNAQNKRKVSGIKDEDGKCCPESGSGVKTDYKFKIDNDVSKSDNSRKHFKTSTTTAHKIRKIKDFKIEDVKGCSESGSGIKTDYKFEKANSVLKGGDSRKQFKTSTTNAGNRTKVSNFKDKDGKGCLESGSCIKADYKFVKDNDVSKGYSRKQFKTSTTNAQDRRGISRDTPLLFETEKKDRGSCCSEVKLESVSFSQRTTPDRQEGKTLRQKERTDESKAVVSVNRGKDIVCIFCASFFEKQKEYHRNRNPRSDNRTINKGAAVLRIVSKSLSSGSHYFKIQFGRDSTAAAASQDRTEQKNSRAATSQTESDDQQVSTNDYIMKEFDSDWRAAAASQDHEPRNTGATSLQTKFDDQQASGSQCINKQFDQDRITAAHRQDHDQMNTRAASFQTKSDDQQSSKKQCNEDWKAAAASHHHGQRNKTGATSFQTKSVEQQASRSQCIKKQYDQDWRAAAGRQNHEQMNTRATSFQTKSDDQQSSRSQCVKKQYDQDWRAPAASQDHEQRNNVVSSFQSKSDDQQAHHACNCVASSCKIQPKNKEA